MLPPDILLACNVCVEAEDQCTLRAEGGKAPSLLAVQDSFPAHQQESLLENIYMGTITSNCQLAPHGQNRIPEPIYLMTLKNKKVHHDTGEHFANSCAQKGKGTCSQIVRCKDRACTGMVQLLRLS